MRFSAEKENLFGGILGHFLGLFPPNSLPFSVFRFLFLVTPNLNLYLLIELLWVESQRVPMNCFLLTTDKFGDYQSKQNSSFTSTLMCYWKNFNDGFYSSVEALHVEVTELVKNKYQFNFNRNIAN